MSQQNNVDIISFYCWDKSVQYTVKKDFFKRCYKPELLGPWDLHKSGIESYLHNPTGPAIWIVQTDEKHYYLDGKPLTAEFAEKIIHHNKFYSKVGDFLKD